MPGKTPANRPYCRGIVKSGPNAGDSCRNRAAAGSAFCNVHGGGGRRVGRETTLTPDLREALTEGVKAGLTFERAAIAAGVPPATFKDWRAKGRSDVSAGRMNTAYAALASELTRAEAVGERELVDRIRAASLEDWRAAAHLLARRHPERWAERSSVDVTTHEASKPRDVTPSPEKAARIRELLGAALTPPPGVDAAPDTL